MPCDRASDERRRRDRSAARDRRWTVPRRRHLWGGLERGRITGPCGGLSIRGGRCWRGWEPLRCGVVTAHRLAHRALPHGGLLIRGAGRGWGRTALLCERRELRTARRRPSCRRHLRPWRERDRCLPTTTSRSAIRGRRRRCRRVSAARRSAIRGRRRRRVTAAHSRRAGCGWSSATTASGHASTAHVACGVGVLEHPTAARAGPHPALLSAGSPGGLPEGEG